MHWPTVVVGVLALALILGVRFLAPAVPGALVLVVAGILGADLFDLEAHGVALVGDVPSGLPTPQLPDLELVADNLATVFVAAFALVLIGFSQTAGTPARSPCGTGTASTSIRSPWPRAWPTPARASSRACRSRRASRRAR